MTLTRDKHSKYCTWFARDCARATWAYVLETVCGAMRRLYKISNSAFECDYYYYCYYYYVCFPQLFTKLCPLHYLAMLCKYDSIFQLHTEPVHYTTWLCCVIMTTLLSCTQNPFQYNTRLCVVIMKTSISYTQNPTYYTTWLCYVIMRNVVWASILTWTSLGSTFRLSSMQVDNFRFVHVCLPAFWLLASVGHTTLTPKSWGSTVLLSLLSSDELAILTIVLLSVFYPSVAIHDFGFC